MLFLERMKEPVSVSGIASVRDLSRWRGFAHCGNPTTPGTVTKRSVAYDDFPPDTCTDPDQDAVSSRHDR